MRVCASWIKYTSDDEVGAEATAQVEAFEEKQRCASTLRNW
jgi:hypothetical protein